MNFLRFFPMDTSYLTDGLAIPSDASGKVGEGQTAGITLSSKNFPAPFRRPKVIPFVRS
ncbi:MAG: hypothetical protein ACI9OJ_004601, partial [Myxococcota bacterium]